MIFEKLGNLCKITSGGTPNRGKFQYFENGDIPWIKTGDLGKKFVTESVEKITKLGLDNSSAKIFPANTVLVAMYGATIGSCAILSFEASTNQACAAFLPTQKLNHEYLYYFLRSIKQTLISMGKGGGQPNISSGILKKVEIPLPPINDQIRIAHLLGKVEGLIAQRKQHLQQLDDLLKSVFLEMFGDPVRNEKEWDVQPCEKAILDISSGTSYGGEDRPFESPDEIGVLKISAVTKGVFDPTEFKVVDPSQIKKALRFVKRGDFLFSRANTIELVAACCVVQKDYNQLFLPDKLWVITINQDFLVSQYFNFLLKNERYRGVVRNLASGGHDSMLNISMKKFMTLNIPCPPLDLQNQFATIVEKVEALKARYQQSLNDLESLYGALSQQAFKGELDLSKIPLPDSKNLTSDVVEISIDSMQTLKSSEKVINNLNTFNSQHGVLLEALNSMPALKIVNSPVFKAARELTEQAALWRTPLDQFKNMRSVAKAAETIAVASNIAGVNNAALLAQQIASAVPKMDMDWLKDQQAIINTATGPFSEMQKAMATLKLSEPLLRMREFENAMPAFQAALPITPETGSRLTVAARHDDDESEPRYIFTRDDILQVLSADTPLSVIDLMSKLAELEVITPQGYNRIKNLLFSLLAEEQIQQQYNDEENSIAFRTCA